VEVYAQHTASFLYPCGLIYHSVISHGVAVFKAHINIVSGRTARASSSAAYANAAITIKVNPPPPLQLEFECSEIIICYYFGLRILDRGWICYLQG